MGSFGERNKPTGERYIFKCPRKGFAVGIEKYKIRFYKAGFASIDDAMAYRDKELMRLYEMYGKRQEETYGTLPPVEEQCERCGRPHLPGSKYCEFHIGRKYRDEA